MVTADTLIVPYSESENMPYTKPLLTMVMEAEIIRVENAPMKVLSGAVDFLMKSRIFKKKL